MDTQTEQLSEFEKLSLEDLQKLFDEEISRTLEVIHKANQPAEIVPSQEEKKPEPRTSSTIPFDSIPLENLHKLVKIEREIEIKQALESQKTELDAHPLMLEDRKAALQKMEELTEKISAMKQDIFDKTNELMPTTYIGFVEKYLGKDYKVPHIKDLAFPNLNIFDIRRTPEILGKIDERMYEDNITKLTILTEKASKGEYDESMTSLGHVFSTVVQTEKGYKIVVDEVKTKEYVKIAEIIRNIPIKYITKYPNIVAHKVMNLWIEFFKYNLQQEPLEKRLALTKTP